MLPSLRALRSLDLGFANPNAWLIVWVALANAVVVVLAGLLLFDLHEDGMAQSKRNAVNTARLLEADIEQLLNSVDLTLRDVTTDFAAHQERGPQALRAWLETVRGRRPDLGLLAVTDADGAVVNLDSPSGRLNVADRDYFRRLRADASAGLELSPPLHARTDGTAVIAAARRLRTADNRFAGVAVAALPLERFSRAAAALERQGSDRFAIWDGGGRLLASVPANDRSPPPGLHAGERDGDRGSFEIDDGRRLNAYSRNPRYGFTVVVETVPEVPGIWSTQVAVAGFGYLLFAAGSLAFSGRTLQWRRRQIEHTRAIESSRAHVRAFFDHAMLGMATLTPDGRWLSVNPALTGMAGIAADDLLGRSWREIATAPNASDDIRKFRDVAEGRLDGHSADMHLVGRDGRPIEALVALRAVRGDGGRIDFLALCAQDISARVAAEARARDALAMCQSFIDHFPGTAFVKDEQRRVLMISRAAASMFGTQAATMVGKRNEDIIEGTHGAYIDAMNAADERVLTTGRSDVVTQAFGSKVLRARKFAIQGGDGRRMIGGFTLDITTQQRSEERIRGLLAVHELDAALAEPALIERGIDIARQVVGADGVCLQYRGDDAADEPTVAWSGCPAVEDAHGGSGAFDVAVLWKRPELGSAGATIEHVAAAPGAVPSRRLTVPLIDGGRMQALIGAWGAGGRDDEFDVQTLLLLGHHLWRVVCQRRAEHALQRQLERLQSLNRQLEAAQTQLLQSEKMASIGLLAAGVAHELNNPISFVQSNLGTLAGYVEDLVSVIEHCARRASASSDAAEAVALERLMHEKDIDFVIQDLRQLLAESNDGADRVRRIVQNLKEFSHVSEDEWSMADLHHGIDSTLNIVWSELKYKCELHKRYGDLPLQWCMPAQLNQVFMNLLVNAAHAIQSRGSITITTAATEREVRIDIEDTGCGIEAEHLTRIFDPFFTTKPVGQGTGLGLSLTFSIVKKHGGDIAVRSTPGAGACFSVTLPRRDRPGVEAEPAAPATT